MGATKISIIIIVIKTKGLAHLQGSGSNLSSAALRCTKTEKTMRTSLKKMKNDYFVRLVAVQHP